MLLQTSRGRLLFFGYECLLIGLLTAAILVWGPGLGTVDRNNPLYADFVSFYRMGKIVLSPDRYQIYDQTVQLKYFNDLKVAQHSDQIIYAQNPPFFFLLLAPFALLPIEPSFRVWIALSVISAASALSFFLRSFEKVNLRLIVLVLVAACVSFPGWFALTCGQTSWFMLTVLTLYFWALLKDKEFWSGLLLTLSLCKFQYCPFLIVPLIAKRRWRSIVWAVMLLALLLCFSALVLGWHNVIGYPKILFGAETTRAYEGVFPEYMISLRGLISNLTDRKIALVLSSFTILGGLAPLYLWWHRTQSTGIKAYWLVVITTLMALILSPHAHIYDDVFLAIAAAGVILALTKQESVGRIEATVRPELHLLLVLLLCFPVASWIITCLITVSFDAVKRIPFLLYNLVLLVLAIRLARKTS